MNPKDKTEVTVKIIDRAHRADICIPNQPFPLTGLLLPSYNNGKWDYTAIEFAKENRSEMVFPDELYDYDKMSSDHIFIGAYAGEQCVGLAVLQHAFFKHLYLYDLKVNADFRGCGIGAQLIEAAKRISLEQGYCGLYTIGQDNNLGACLFYLKNGFVIGGLDTHVYKGTAQSQKKDIIFYWEENQ